MIISKKQAPEFIATLIRFVGVGIFVVSLSWLIMQLIQDTSFPLAAILTVIMVFGAVVFLIDRLKPYRWMSIGLGLAMLFVLYPILYTFFLSFTNTGHGHILTKQQVIERLEREQYIPADGQRFIWTAFRDEAGGTILWLQNADGTSRLVGLAASNAEPSAAVGEFDVDGIPLIIEGYQRLERRDVIVMLDQLGSLEFGTAPNTIRIMSISAAATTRQRYHYDSEQDALIDLETDTPYFTDEGTFRSAEGTELRPGYFVNIGFRNFDRFFSSAALRGPLSRIITWNFAYAVFSVLLSFSLGLFIAILFDDLPGKKVIRTLLIVPYPIPALVSILIWRNLLNPDFGVLVSFTESIFGASPRWLTDPNATRVAILLVNMWLSYPYFYIVSSGALQALPTEMLEAASVDGANPWQRFRKITFPLLLQIVSPLLVASFAFNFNNFNLIYIFNEGNPPIAGAPIPAGHTDILISFVYKLAFNSAQSDYGLAATISIVLFVFVALITWLQFRYTRILEDSI